ncbi:uncharacterized protein SPPG_05930 [Spizellomyces punctatus DAOM BR117]|uniref:Protein FAM184A/B N-terminal domain-containing protein n=1 Tax=Spizellomyces punctatus (strain DAOM BR117) TaxID=645134 RepID=A0A0L0HDC1_SPIPD|nr:uncharacterized protein SPPG_05930 [Spizellomyces punctatus DAOM BR117]KNC98974.1 hypothetical protein SPPG_05930 [Spizellomyces punctatus DAOM BR117]|eukprot:XP_016607014.1 hypothetical protein SPPG_05930 [Spizellomyces punctatus DAOM BR117]
MLVAEHLSIRRSRGDKLAESSSSSSLSLSAKGVAAPPDVVYKLSKKIAQLTKVIYYLNTKNEDHTTEIQSLAEAYEDEIQEVVEDGQSRIQVLQSKVEDGELKLRAHEEVIQSYLETISTHEAGLDTLRQRVAELEDSLNEAEREKIETARTHEEQLQEMEKTVKLRCKEEEEASGLRSNYESMLQEQSDKHEKELEEVKRQSLVDLEALRAEYTKKLQAVNDDRQKLDDSLKDAVSTVKSRHQDEIKFQQQEIKQLRQALDDQVKDSTAQIKTLETRLTAAYEQEHERLLESQAALKETKQTLQQKGDQALELEGELNQTTIKLRDSKIKLEDYSNRISSLEKDIATMVTKLNIADERTRNLEMLSNAKEKQLADLSVALTQEADEKASIKSDLDALTAQHQTTLATLNKLQEEMKLYDAEKMENERKFLAQAKAYEELEQQMQAERLKHEELLATSLTLQKSELQAAFTAEMSEQLLEAQRKHDEALQKKVQEIVDLQQQFADHREASERQMEQLQRAAKDTEEALKELLKTKEKEMADLAHHLEDVTSTLEDRMMEISKHLITIQHQSETIRGLEVDKADLFQKMVHIDEQIRTEMRDNFEKEKLDLADAWDLEAKLENQRLRDSLNQGHAQDLQAAMAQKEKDHEEQVQAIRLTQQKEIAKMQRMVSNAEGTAANLEKEKALLQKQIQDMGRKYREELILLAEKHDNALQEARRAWEIEVQSRETQLKVASTIALAQLEKKLQTEREEADVAHKRQLDDLRAFHTMSNMAAKKEAEALRLVEANNLKMEFEQEMLALRQRLLEDRNAKVAEIQQAHAAELQNLEKQHSSEINSKEDAIKSLHEEVISLKSIGEALRTKVTEQLNVIEQLREDVDARVAEIEDLREESESKLAALREDLLDQQKQEISRNNEQHIEEVQQMLREFEHAQTYLKKQIATQKNQLHEADIKYINREPREVDVQRIAQLEEDLRQAKQIIEALMEELQYYKLELNNREANFNKIFNKAPVVGVIQPIGLSTRQNKSNSRSYPSLNSSRLPPLPTPQPAPPA